MKQKHTTYMIFYSLFFNFFTKKIMILPCLKHSWQKYFLIKLPYYWFKKKKFKNMIFNLNLRLLSWLFSCFLAKFKYFLSKKVMTIGWFWYIFSKILESVLPYSHDHFFRKTMQKQHAYYSAQMLFSAHFLIFYVKPNHYNGVILIFFYK